MNKPISVFLEYHRVHKVRFDHGGKYKAKPKDNTAEINVVLNFRKNSNNTFATHFQIKKSSGGIDAIGGYDLFYCTFGSFQTTRPIDIEGDFNYLAYRAVNILLPLAKNSFDTFINMMGAPQKQVFMSSVYFNQQHINSIIDDGGIVKDIVDMSQYEKAQREKPKRKLKPKPDRSKK